MTPTLYDKENRRNKIIDFVKDNDRPTKADVIRYMDDNGFSSLMTTHADIAALIKKKIFIIERDRPNSQTHHLVINDKSVFNRIGKIISDIKGSLEMFDQIQSDLRKQNIALSREFYDSFVPAYHKLNLMMLIRLLEISNKKIHSENNYKSIDKQIIELITRLQKQVYLWMPADEELSYGLEFLRNFFTETGIKKSLESARLIDNQITKIEKYENFLLDFEYP